MGFADVWSRTLVYFGIAEEDEEWDEEGYLANEELERTYAERPNVRRLAPRRRRDFDDWADPDPEPDDRTAVIRPAPRLRGVESVPASVGVHPGMQRVADKVFLLTPQNVEVSAEERARLLERGGFFNQA